MPAPLPHAHRRLARPPPLLPSIAQERIARLEAQCKAKHDAAESSIEEQLRDKVGGGGGWASLFPQLRVLGRAS